MKQRISKDLVERRYIELLKSGMSIHESIYRIGRMVLNFYNINLFGEENSETRRILIKQGIRGEKVL